MYLKTKEEELTLLTKCFETLKLTYLETLAKAYTSPIINVDACTTNSSSDLASILEENRFLKAQIEKVLMTCAQGQKNLNEVLSQHNEVFAKEGLGFDPSTSKKKTSSQKCTTPLKETFVREGHKEKGKVVSGKATRACPLSTSQKSSCLHPMYFVRLRMEKFMQSLLVLEMHFGFMLFGSLRPL